MASQTSDTIAECLAQAQSDSPEAKNNALLTLSSLTKVSMQNRNLLFQTHEAVPLLLTLSKSHTTQILSLSILFNLSLNPNLKHPLANTHFIHHLHSILLSPGGSPQARKLAASLICSLAMLDKNKAQFGVAGTVEVIVEALRGHAHESAIHYLVSSLAELMQYHGNCTLALRAGAVPLLLKNLEGPVEDLAASLTILALLARYKEGIKAIQEVDGVGELLADGLQKGCMASRENAAEILVRLFEESQQGMKEAAKKHDLLSSVADLAIRGSAKAREKAGVLMRMMMEDDLDLS
ncbi:U-box domain-containing protein 39-like [Typha latifolia]|uniref:U-box domain-containing protein 39-like n=1 Tax=Typha latifolia TaxID=4733 RepID=UPI003C2B5538